MDFLWNTYSKCRTDDRQDQMQNGEICMTWFYWQNQKRSSDLFRSVMSWRIKLCNETQKNDNKNGMRSDCHLSSLYAILFLGTFTEYPWIKDSPWARCSYGKRGEYVVANLVDRFHVPMFFLEFFCVTEWYAHHGSMFQMQNGFN